MNTSSIKSNKFKFPIWGWFFVFFAVLFIADGIMAYLAVSTWNGLTNNNAYNDGINYNQTLEMRKNQKEEGWKQKLSIRQNKNLLSIKVEIKSEKLGYMPKNAKVKVKFFRPTNEGFDQEISLTPIKKGIFMAKNINLPLQGNWDIKITTTQNNKTYNSQKRVDIRW